MSKILNPSDANKVYEVRILSASEYAAKVKKEKESKPVSVYADFK